MASCLFNPHLANPSMNCKILCGAVALCLSFPAVADENLFGYLKGAETLPKGAGEVYQFVTLRTDKGVGHYRAVDLKTEGEYGFSNSLTGAAGLKAMSLNTSGIMINGYLPGDKEFGLKATGVEGTLKYNFLSPAKDDIGLSMTTELNYDWIDAHSGQNKKKVEFELGLQLQKLFAEGQVSWVGNAALETTYAKRKPIANLPDDFEWPTHPEMEIGLKFGTGVMYRFASNWSAGAEVLYQSEFETEVGQERWSLFGGPTLHYGDKQWWATLTVMPQLRGGGERYDGQTQTRYHLIEKTRQEVRFKVGYNF
jgi:opacity protein-like surface antigen